MTFFLSPLFRYANSNYDEMNFSASKKQYNSYIFSRIDSFLISRTQLYMFCSIFRLSRIVNENENRFPAAHLTLAECVSVCAKLVEQNAYDFFRGIMPC